MLSVRLTCLQEVPVMTDHNVQQVFQNGYADYTAKNPFLSDVQRKAAKAILLCKTDKLGFQASFCTNCAHLKIHYRSCRNRNCPSCQAVNKEIWVDKRSAEVIDTPYFHVVFTIPHELNALFYANQKLLYDLLHRCCAETLLELSADPKWLGAAPAIIQVLHTWNQELGYHVHMHCIVSGGGLSRDGKLRRSSSKFFLPVRVLRDRFKGKFLARLSELYAKGALSFSASCKKLQTKTVWNAFKNTLYEKDWCPYIKQTFHRFANAIEYLGRYTHKIAISNSRILSVTDAHVTFSARGRKPKDPKRRITLTHAEFIRRYLMHVLPKGFQKIRYYGLLNNRMKAKNLQRVFTLQGRQSFKRLYEGFRTAQFLSALWKIDICRCPRCGHSSMKPLKLHYANST